MSVHALLLIATFPVALLLVIALVRKQGLARPEHRLLIFFLIVYSMALFDKVREETGWFLDNRGANLYLTPWFAFGPLIYLYFRRTLLPAKKSLPGQLEYVIFLPALLELLYNLIGWGAAHTLDDRHPIRYWLNELVDPINTLSFYYLIFFVVLSVIFLVRQRALDKYRILYPQQLRWLGYFSLSMALIIVAELVGSAENLLYYPTCGFIYLLAYRMITTPRLFSSDEAQCQEWLRQAFQERARGVAITDTEQQVVYTNAVFQTTTGYTNKELMGRDVRSLWADEGGGADVPPAAAGPTETTRVSYRKSGEAYQSHWHAMPVRHRGQFTHLIYYLDDRGTVATATPNEQERATLGHAQRLLEDADWYGNPHLQQRDVAEALDISSRAFGELLSRYTGQTFPQWLGAVRVAAAQRLLATPEWSKLTVIELAQRVGFNSKTAFYTAFKKKTGLTPTQYRRQQQRV